jgi:hypothetical protein
MPATTRRKHIALAASSILLFALSQDFWAWHGPPALGPLGVPRWVYLFALLQFALAIVIYTFGKNYLGSDDDRADRADRDREDER